jgi:FG-GAP-like repeat
MAAGLLVQTSALPMGLMAAPDAQYCAHTFAQQEKAVMERHLSAPAAAKKRLPGSKVMQGAKELAWAWLASPTTRYPHASMGSPIHAGSLHLLTREGREYSVTLPKQRVFEDIEPRWVDMDGDGLEEIILIEADSERGAALVSYGLRASGHGKMQLQELARSSFLGLPFRWLSPVGFADFDGDGKLDIASVTTPHIGGVLTLYRYAPPRIEPFAKAMDVSNHQMGDPNLQMHAVLSLPGTRPTVIVPDMTRRALHALRWETVGGKSQWKELADVKPLPGRVVYLMPSTGASACAQLNDGSWWRIELTH